MSKRTFSSFSILLLLILLHAGQAFAQTPTERRANRLYENYAYSQAIELYEHLLKKNPENKAVIRNLADAYWKTNNATKSEQWIKRVIEVGIAQNQDYLHLAMALEINGNREEAQKNFKKYDELMAADKRGARFLGSLNSISDLFSESDAYRIEKLKTNSAGSDFSPAIYSQGAQKFLIVASNGFSEDYTISIFPWNNRRWLDLWTIPMTNDSTPGLPSRLPGTINSKYHEGPVSWNASGNTLAFTRNSFFKGKVSRSADHINKLNIYFTQFKENTWSEAVPFEHNNTEYSTGHPAFSRDGKTMYFVSDMPGGLGGTDIYVSMKDGNSWSKPQNLGPNVNSEGNEMFPYFWKDSVLCFASNGWGGLGGLDVMKTWKENGAFVTPVNAGSPINSSFDDFGFISEEDGKSGYFSSNREGGADGDDVYRFTFSPMPSTITVKDQDEMTPVSGAKVDVMLDGKSVGSYTADASGIVKLMLTPCKKYSIKASAEGYPESTKEQETGCKAYDLRDYQMVIKRPKLYVNVFDKYNNKDIAGALVSVIDITAGEKPVGLGETDEKGLIRFFLDPCHEYEVLAQKKGLPDTKQKVKAPCTNLEKDAAVKLGTGIAPLQGVLVKFVATDEQTGAPVPNAKIRLINKTENTEVDLLADEKGEYETVLKENTEVLVSATRVGYFATSKSKASFKISKGDKNVTKNLKLLKLTEGGIIALEGIFYDLNKTEIRPDAAKVLDYVYDVLLENPGMVIEMGSHTDARGSDETNLKLSDGRAIAAAQYIIGKGIPADRITGKGYGETRLNNKCGNDVKCTEAQHQENRRTEIRIVEFD